MHVKNHFIQISRFEQQQQQLKTIKTRVQKIYTLNRLSGRNGSVVYFPFHKIQIVTFTAQHIGHRKKHKIFQFYCILTILFRATQ